MSSTFNGCRYVELREQGLKADLVTYNTLLKACMRSANLPCAEVIMAWLQQQGLQVSLSRTQLVTTHICSRNHESKKACNAVKRVLWRSLPMLSGAVLCCAQGSEYTYNTMVKVASYAGSLERALAVLDDMDSAGVAPTPAVWGSLLVACGKVHNLCQPHRLEAIRL